MPRQIFVNLPVKNLERSKLFFTSLGFGFDPEFTNESAACLVISDNIYAMLLTHNFFRAFTSKDICDSARETEVLVCISCESREEVERLAAAARAAGGTIPREPMDHGTLYEHAFEDLDGHTWELMYMQPR